MTIRIIAAAFLALPVALSAQMPMQPGQSMAGMGGEGAPPATCPATPAPLPPELAGWAGRAPVVAASDDAGLAAAMLVPGKGADVALKPTPSVRYPTRPSHPGGSVSSGGLLAFDVAQAGTYRVAIGSGAWLEVVRDGQAVESTAHGHGPACTGIGKMVDFPLTQGRYLLEIAGNGSPAIPVLVTRLP